MQDFATFTLNHYPEPSVAVRRPCSDQIPISLQRGTQYTVKSICKYLSNLLIRKRALTLQASALMNNRMASIVAMVAKGDQVLFRVVPRVTAK